MPSDNAYTPPSLEHASSSPPSRSLSALDPQLRRPLLDIAFQPRTLAQQHAPLLDRGRSRSRTRGRGRGRRRNRAEDRGRGLPRWTDEVEWMDWMTRRRMK